MVAVVEEESTGAAGARAGEGYRPHLDGLRAVAVYLVILFHAGIDRFSGGFIGVDVFFVLSGYLVTQLLMRDLHADGTIRFARFYSRRMRRLLPASLVALLVTGVVYSAVAAKADTASAVNAFKASFLYVANWFFIRRSSNYFATDINTNPVVHFWSLAVEEQFYFLWPILLATLFAITRRLDRYAQRVLQLVVGAGGLVSMLWALHLAHQNLNRAYYGTDTRAYQLLAGALLALTPGVVIRIRARAHQAAVVAAPLALVALVVLSTSLISGMTTVGRGIAAMVTSVVLIAAIEGARSGPVNRVLSSGPAVYLGKISYGTYLWHWPVIVVITLSVTSKTISPVSMFAIAAPLATGLASLSYHLVERPIREERLLDRISPAVIAGGLSIAVVAALVVVPAVIDPYRAHAATAPAVPTAGFTPIPALDFAGVTDFPHALAGVRFLKGWNCEGKPAARCTIIKGTGPKVLVIGDSHAQMFMVAFAKIAQTQHLTLAEGASAGCPWQRDVYLPEDDVGNDKAYTKACISFKHDLYDRVIPALKPDIVVAISNDYLTRRVGDVLGKNDKPLASNGAADLQRLEATDTRTSLDAMRPYVKHVLIVDPVPTSPKFDPFRCLTKSKFLEDCRFIAPTDPTPLRRIYSGLANDKQVDVANLDKLICPYWPICDPVVNGLIVRRDPEHLSPAFSFSLAGPLTTLLQNDSLIPVH